MVKRKINKEQIKKYVVRGTIESPCVGICNYTNDNDFNNDDICLTCYRTIDEITGWIYYNDDERQKIIDKAKIRKKIYNINNE